MNIIISPIFNQYMAGRIWMGLDIQVFEKHLKNLGWNTQIISFNNLVENIDDIAKNCVLFYSSIYNPDYLKYIQDTILLINQYRPDIQVIPSYNQLHSLDNKGYQEYMKKVLNIERVNGKYYGDINDLLLEKETLEYPFVLKENKGALSSGVHLIKSNVELIKIQKKLKKRSIKEKLALELNRKNSFKKDLNLDPPLHLYKENFNSFFEKRTPVITQEFIPNLKFDYKVLQFGDKYYSLKRFTRENDFRASGSGKVSFEETPEVVLNYAKQIVDKLETPFVSLDIGIDSEENCYLFEFQGTGFGPLTLTKSEFYYQFKNGNWVKTNANSKLEIEYANAINYFAKTSNENN
ncbi:MAG: hypothetical protein ACR2MS_03275 [Weeksellaceae bacterium]